MVGWRLDRRLDKLQRLLFDLINIKDVGNNFIFSGVVRDRINISGCG